MNEGKTIFAFVLTIFFALTIALPTEASDNQAQPAESSARVDAPVSVEKPTEEESTPGLLDNFLNSDFVRTSVWPGIGPFVHNADEQSGGLSDPSQNHLTYSTNGKQISLCELELHGNVGETQSLLNLQMSTDFLLEGLGVKPGQIHSVNVELGKKVKLLTVAGNNYNPVPVIISPLMVSFQNLGLKEGSENPLFRVVVVNQNLISKEDRLEKNIDSSKSTASEQPGGEIETASASDQKAKIEVIEGNKITQQTPVQPLPEKPDQTTVIEANANSSSVNDLNKDQAASEAGSAADAPTSPDSATKTLTKDEQLKQDFLAIIQNWQRTKKTAVKERQVSLLSQSLSGKALVRQSDAIKWLINNHKYYDMTPQGAKVEHFITLVPQKKYAVFAEVKEKTKLVDESGKQAGKETVDGYKVNYTIEKIGQHWLITDSTLVKLAAGKPVKSTH